MSSEISLAWQQFEAMFREHAKTLSADKVEGERKRLARNPTLEKYYADKNRLCVSVDGEIVEKLPCERFALEYPCDDPHDPSQWQDGPRGQVNMARSPDGSIWAKIGGDHSTVYGPEPIPPSRYPNPVFLSVDGGVSWEWTPGASNTGLYVFAFTILMDGTFLAAGNELKQNSSLAGMEGSATNVIASKDQGRTWARQAKLSVPAPHVVVEEDVSSMIQLSDGTVLLTACHRVSEPGGQRIHSVFRSGDSGATWTPVPTVWDQSELPLKTIHGTIMCSESHILELSSGRLLHAFRWNFDTRTAAELIPKKWLPFKKTVCFMDSTDKGITWQNPRPAVDEAGRPVLVQGECHGQLVAAPDGRIVLVHDHRYPTHGSETVAHVSSDEGQTWGREAYHISLGDSYPSSVVLEDGTIVTIGGGGLLRDDRFDEKGQSIPLGSKRLWTQNSIRWKLSGK